MTDFDRALKQTLGFEGGGADNPFDRGGHTNKGFTQRLYDAWRDAKKLPRQDVKLITDVEIVTIAREEFWDPCRCPELPEALALAVFDMAFNSSPNAAKRTLQAALGVTIDGLIGSGTIAAAKAVGDAGLLPFLKAHAGYIAEIVIHDASQSIFIHGWVNRLLDQAAGASK